MDAQPSICAIQSMLTTDGRCLNAPSVEAVARQLDRMALTRHGASITLCASQREMRVKFVPGRGYYVITYGDDFCVDEAFLSPSAVVTLEAVSAFGDAA